MNMGTMNRKIALITGASSGIGQAIANELCRQNFRVYAASRSMPDYFSNPECEQVEDAGSIRPVKLDVNNEKACIELVAAIMNTEGRMDYLVQAAGYGLAGAVEDTKSEEARSQMETNFFGTLNLLSPVLNQMRRQGSGLIVQIGSVAGLLPIPFQAFYSASKASLAALTLALADEIRPWGVRCMLVQPGDTQTGFTRSRVMAGSTAESDYAERVRRSVERMAADEHEGISAQKSARRIVRQMMRRHPPLVYTVGFAYQLISIANRLLPVKMVRRIIGLIYAS